MEEKGFEGHPGTSKLASVLSRRMKQENDAPLIFDFGEIQPNGSLKTNTFPVPIPKGDYTICRTVAGLILKPSTKGQHDGHTSGDGIHDHDIPIPKVKPGDRVIVAWVQSEAVVIDVIERS